MSEITWLNGWPQIDDSTVIVGNATRCVCCGFTFGIYSVAIGPEVETRAEPTWPFAQDTCPMEHAVKRRAHLAGRGVRKPKA